MSIDSGQPEHEVARNPKDTNRYLGNNQAIGNAKRYAPSSLVSNKPTWVSDGLHKIAPGTLASLFIINHELY